MVVLQDILSKYQNYDKNSDDDFSIISMDLLKFEIGAPVSSEEQFILVLIESRLLNQVVGAVDLMPKLLRFKDDLTAEGLSSRLIRVNLYNGNHHQDGKTLLAIRSFLKEVKIAYPNFLGIILVGAFPEASIVRRFVWNTNLAQVIRGHTTEPRFHLRIVPEMVATRADIVLADLDGNWDSLYHEGPEGLESIDAFPDVKTARESWPVDNQDFTSTEYDHDRKSFRDFFWIDDADFQVRDDTGKRITILVRRRPLHREVSPSRLSLPNPMAKPNIFVSRINALQVAYNPDPSIHGDNGILPLDEKGNPQAFSSINSYQTDQAMFSPDPILERRLLCDYLDLNHKFRTGSFSHLPFRVGSIASNAFSASSYARKLSEASNQFQQPVVRENASLLDYVNWFKQPVALRYIMAHSDDFNSEFETNYNDADLANSIGGSPFRWTHNGNTYQLSFQGQNGDANFFVHRTMWQNHLLDNTGANLIIHGGCNAMSPQGTQQYSYYQNGYAPLQNGEGILFYTNTLAIMGRAKVYRDYPDGFTDPFRDSSNARFGDGWAAHFDNNSANPILATFEKVADSKVAYAWCILGDWTLKLRY